MQNFLPLIIVLVVVAIVIAVIKNLIPKGKGQTLPYEKQPSLFTPAERSFLGVLEQAVGNEFRIMGKVRLGDIVKVKAGLDNKARQSAFNRIQSKHVDFIACDPNDLSIQFVIELDDKSHEREDRQDRDAFVDRVMEAAGIPIIHFPAKRAYAIQDIRDTLTTKLNPPEETVKFVSSNVKSAPATKPAPVVVPISRTPPPPSQAVILDANTSPQCPSCSGEMVKRKAKSGQNAGNEFWGCSNYPKCREILSIA